MFELTITTSETASAPSWEDNGAGVAVWPDRDGNPAAYCYRRDGVRYIDLPSVGSYRFGEDAGQIVVTPSPLASAETIVDRHRRTVVPLALQALGYEVLHASAVSLPRGVVAFCGPSGIGKSTVACAFGHRGYAVRADDVVVLRFAGRSASIVPLPFKLRPTYEAEFVLGGLVKPPPNDEIAGQPLAAVVALERSHGADSDVSRVLPSDTFQTLFSHGLSFSEHDRERMAVMTERYLALAATVPTYRARTTGLNHLDALIDRIEAELAE